MLRLELIPILQTLHEKKVHYSSHHDYGSVEVVMTGIFHFQTEGSQFEGAKCSITSPDASIYFDLSDVEEVAFTSSSDRGPRIDLKSPE